MNILCRGLLVSILWTGLGFATAGLLGDFAACLDAWP